LGPAQARQERAKLQAERRAPSAPPPRPTRLLEEEGKPGLRAPLGLGSGRDARSRGGGGLLKELLPLLPHQPQPLALAAGDDLGLLVQVPVVVAPARILGLRVGVILLLRIGTGGSVKRVGRYSGGLAGGAETRWIVRRIARRPLGSYGAVRLRAAAGAPPHRAVVRDCAQGQSGDARRRGGRDKSEACLASAPHPALRPADRAGAAASRERTAGTGFGGGGAPFPLQTRVTRTSGSNSERTSSFPRCSVGTRLKQGAQWPGEPRRSQSSAAAGSPGLASSLAAAAASMKSSSGAASSPSPGGGKGGGILWTPAALGMPALRLTAFGPSFGASRRRSGVFGDDIGRNRRFLTCEGCRGSRRPAFGPGAGVAVEAGENSSLSPLWLAQCRGFRDGRP